MPTTEAFLDHPSLCFTPDIYIVELIGDVARVRFQGAGLDSRWAAPLTGHDLHEGLPAKVRRRSLENMRRVVTQPCGYLARNAYTTTLNRTVTADLIQLPLAVKAGRPPRLVCLTVMPRSDDDDAGDLDEIIASFHTAALSWLDLGAGMPDEPPHDVLD